jgi:hypothetical protein
MKFHIARFHRGISFLSRHNYRFLHFLSTESGKLVSAIRDLRTYSLHLAVTSDSGQDI